MASFYSPDLATFRQKAKEGNLIPVFRELPGDLDTPVSLFLKLGQRPPTFLLESVEGGEKVGRYSFLGLSPYLVLEASGKEATLSRGARRLKVPLEGRDALHLVQEHLAQHKAVKMPGVPPFFGGAVGYLSYDMARFFERLPETSLDELALPDALFLFTDTMVIFDHVQHKIKVLANAHVDGKVSAAYEEAVARIEEVVRALERPLPETPREQTALREMPNLDYDLEKPLSHETHREPAPAAQEMTSNFTPEEFAAMVRAAKEYIVAGDIFQIVLAQRLRRRTTAEPFAIYRALRMINPSPYLFYLDLGSFQLIGSSPEMLVKLQDGLAEARPIAGTRPRGASEAEDEALIAELLADPKERAEHVMLVDLARNDLGRVCTYGTVRAPTLMTIEKYSHVSHIVSAVEGKLQPGQDAFSLLRAAFPAGTVSGAPKIRAMELIHELERWKRGPYAGAVGYFSFTGNMDTCITIRTIVMQGDRVYL
ncbi:MAG: chorismate-binding protein, partial [Chloroflexota bacterium]|nr:chorismate-binding protein [Chloroflexota bacterium]